ncbi:MAG: hypothetical protein QW146_08820 [Candidatus Bathyarchaeia archaeon]
MPQVVSNGEAVKLLPKRLYGILIFAVVLAALLFLSIAGARVINVTSSDFVAGYPLPSYPLLAMSQEYINYTITRINGSLWAKVDGVFPIRKVFGAGEIFELNGIEYVVISDELPLVYPTPPGTTNISVKFNEAELNWSNYTETHPKAMHHTAIGDWPMIYCKIDEAPSHFTLEIHYEHPISIINGSYTFLYDLNISPYLSPWCNKSTAYFNIRMETSYKDLHVYMAESDNKLNPVNYTITNDETAEVISVKIISEYGKPLLGDLVISFKENSASLALPVEYGYAGVALTVVVATFVGYRFFKHKKLLRQLKPNPNIKRVKGR